MSDCIVGEIAKAKVGRNLVEVEILEDCGNGNYKVKSVSSGREFNTSRLEKINNNQEETSMPEDTNITSEAEIETISRDEDTPNPAPECATSSHPKKQSLFDAAVEVLKRERCPMNTKEIVKRAMELGLWTSTGAKTPEQTLYSAIFRENATKENPRIIKSEQKGKFEIGE